MFYTLPVNGIYITNVFTMQYRLQMGAYGYPITSDLISPKM